MDVMVGDCGFVEGRRLDICGIKTYEEWVRGYPSGDV